jgi:hypothetical protein
MRFFMKEFLAALDLDTIPQVSLGTAALLIFAACALLAMMRGFLRMLVGSLVLCASGFAGYAMWRHAPGLPIVFPVLAGLTLFLLLRFVLRSITRPFGGRDEEKRPSPVRRAFTLLFSLVPASLLSFAGATALRNAGSVAEIRRFVDGTDTHGRLAFTAELKAAIDRALPVDWFKGIDPLSEEARVTLAKLIALGETEPPPKAIPVMEEPEIRALIEGDPKLREFARSKRYADILRDPRLDRVMEDPDLRRMLGNLNL